MEGKAPGLLDELVRNLLAAIVVPVAMITFGQLQDSTSTLRLRLSELADRLQDAWNAYIVNDLIEEERP